LKYICTAAPLYFNYICTAAPLYFKYICTAALLYFRYICTAAPLCTKYISTAAPLYFHQSNQSRNICLIVGQALLTPVDSRLYPVLSTFVLLRDYFEICGYYEFSLIQGTCYPFSDEFFSLKKTVYELCALLGCYAAYSGIFLPTFRENIWVPSKFQDFFTRKHETDRMSQNVGKELLLYAA
jgi:hypothetical protein